MDLKIYYQKIREVEEQIKDEFPILASRETPDGGKAGVFTEVVKRLAAKLLVDGLAELAHAKDAEAFRIAKAEAKKNADDQAAASKIQMTLISPGDLDRLKGATNAKK